METPAEPIDPAVPTPSPKSHFIIWFLVLGIVLLLVIGVGAVYIIGVSSQKANSTVSSNSPTPTIDPTANWKTYTNTKLSFKYPPDYKIKAIENYINVYDKEENLGPNNLYLTINTSLMGSLSNYSTVVKEWSSRDNAQKIDLPNGFKLIYTDEKGLIYQVDAFYKYKEGAIRAFYRATPEIPSQVYDQILSTFKLTN